MAANLCLCPPLSILFFSARLAPVNTLLTRRMNAFLPSCLVLLLSLVLAACGDSAGVKAVRKRAQAGEAQAQFELAQLHMTGKGVKQDEAEARKWCEKAANQGLPAAQRIYGTMLRDAYGSPFRDIPKAREWIAKAAAQGDAEAKVELAATPAIPPPAPKK
jgi:hypothetical protein